MRINSSGKVGIGHDLSTHTQPLVVKQNGAFTSIGSGSLINIVNEQGAGNFASLRFTGTSQNAFVGYFDHGTASTRRLSIGVGADAEHFSFTGDGNVGIGTTSISSRATAMDDTGPVLEVFHNTADSALQLGSDSGGRGLDLWSDHSGANVYFDSRYDSSNTSGGNIFIRTRTADETLTAIAIDQAGEVTFAQDMVTAAIRSSTSYAANISGDTYRDLFVRDDGYFGTMSSSRRYKENIVDMGSIDWLYNLHLVEFDWKEKNTAGETVHDYGLIAEEVYEINPKLTTPDSDGEIGGVTYSKLVPFLLKAVQELSAKVEALENA
jgi:hypothetical protein